MKKFSIFLLAFFALAACSNSTENSTSDTETKSVESIETSTTPETTPQEQATETTQEKPEKTSIRLAMIGDILLHRQIVYYKDYSPALQPIEKSLQSYDFLIANQESLAIGNKFPLAGYPRFSSPSFILQDLKEAGVDFLNLANNHVLDYGESGIRTQFENIKKTKLPYVGAYQSEQDAKKPRIVTIDGIKIGIVSYTYGTNGFKVPEGKDYLVNYIDEAKIKRDIQQIRPKVDVVVANMHWGSEYVTEENETQRHLAKVINDAGGDIIFGGHPHILQPYDEITNASGHTTYTFYSIGNFYATILSGPLTMIGGVASFQITKEADDITINKPMFRASAVLQEGSMYKVFPLAKVENRAPANLDWVRSILGEKVIVK